jgi:hypothetical protein
MRAVVSAWGRRRWPGSRIIHELALGERRVDMVFVGDRDIIGVEIKSSKDTLARLPAQMKEFGRYLPELWLAFAPKWKDADELHDVPNAILIENGEVVAWSENRRSKPSRDELVCSRMLELLWTGEAQAVAQRTGVIPGAPSRQMAAITKKMLARLLTGNEILAEVCRCIRERPLHMVGNGSDGPVRSV